MSSGFDRAIQNLVQIIKESDKNKTFALDTQAEVLRIEDGTAWVHLPGGVDETPVKLTMNAQVGDVVQVRIAGGRAWLTGNATSPPTDDKVANQAMGVAASAQQEAIIVKEVVAENIKATNAKFEYVEADTAKIHNLEADEIHAGITYTNELIAENITAQDIVSDHAEINDLYVNYAQIDAANVTDLSAQNAWVNKIMVQTGLIAHEGAIFTLDAIQVNAANITAGTLDVNRLIVTVDGQKYLVNVDPTTGTPSYEKMDGNIVEPRTITADKIVAHDITVQEITTENLVGTNGWINLNQGKFRYTTNGTTLANSTNGIEWDGTNLKIKGSVDVTAGNVYTKTESDERFGDHLYVDTTYSGSNIVFTARAILDGVDVTSQYLDGDFEWFYRTPTGDVPMNRNGKSISIPQASQEYGRTVVCVFSRNRYANLLTNSGDKLRISTGAYLMGRSEY